MAFTTDINWGALKNKIKSGKQLAVKGSQNGFFHILGGNTIVKVVSAISVLLFPRIMGYSYGTFKLADNFLGYLMIANGLGMANVILRYCSAFDAPGEKKGYFKFAVKFGLIFDIALIVIFAAVLYVPELFGITVVKFGAGKILGMMLLMVFADFLFNASQNFLRTNQENKKFAQNSVIFSLAYAIIPCALSAALGTAGYAMEGAVIGRYIAYVTTLVVIFRMMRSLPVLKEKSVPLRRADKVGAVRYSLNTLVANAFSLIMPYNESIVLSMMVKGPLYSDFQVAQLLPASIQFISSSVVVFVYPYFARNYRDGKWIYENTKRVIFVTSFVMGIIAVLGIIFSPQIVLIFGNKFKTDNAVRLMRVFFVTFAVNSAVRLPVGNILAAIGEVKFNIANAIFSSTIHVGICWTMTYSFGINGAAYGLLSGYVISSVAAVVFLRYYCKKLEFGKNISKGGQIN